ncbi:MAG: ATP-binding protein [Bacteroidota bacterium]
MPLSLVFGSLLLLMGFLYSWLDMSYEAEEDHLRQQTNSLFLNAVRDAKDELLVEFLPKMLQQATEKVEASVDENQRLFAGEDSSSVNVRIHLEQGSSHLIVMEKDGVFPDSVRTKSRIQETKVIVKKELNDTLMRMALSTGVDGGLDKSIRGALAIFTDLENDSTFLSSDSIHRKHREVLPILRENFSQRCSLVNLPGQQQILSWEEAKEVQGLVSEKYSDSWNGKEYAAVLQGYEGQLMRNILPQLLFSLLLLMSIATAFWLMYQAWQKQRRLIEIKNDFISNITHELKTPITTVGVAIEALSNFDALSDPVRTQEYLQISKQELNRLSILVDKVLKMSLFEKQEPELKLESLDLRQLVEEMLASMKLQFEKHKAQVQFHSDGQQFLLQADRIHLTNVLYNLIDNALKYSKEQPQIHIQLSAHPSQLELRVKDHGIGIPKEFQDKIFNKFFRVPKGDAHNVKGYGLGLAYVASVVRQHRGSIELESRASQGSEFRIVLPKDVTADQ